MEGVVNRKLTSQEIEDGHLVTSKFAANAAWSMRCYHGIEKAYRLVRLAYKKGDSNGCKICCNRN